MYLGSFWNFSRVGRGSLVLRHSAASTFRRSRILEAFYFFLLCLDTRAKILKIFLFLERESNPQHIGLTVTRLCPCATNDLIFWAWRETGTYVQCACDGNKQLNDNSAMLSGTTKIGKNVDTIWHLKQDLWHNREFDRKIATDVDIIFNLNQPIDMIIEVDYYIFWFPFNILMEILKNLWGN